MVIVDHSPSVELVKSERAIIPAFAFLRFVQGPKTSEFEDGALERRVRCHLVDFCRRGWAICLHLRLRKVDESIARHAGSVVDPFGGVQTVHSIIRNTCCQITYYTLHITH